MNSFDNSSSEQSNKHLLNADSLREAFKTSKLKLKFANSEESKQNGVNIKKKYESATAASTPPFQNKLNNHKTNVWPKVKKFLLQIEPYAMIGIYF